MISLVHKLRSHLRPSLAAAALLFMLLATAQSFAQQGQPAPAATPQQNVLAAVEFVGLKRVGRPEALAAAALQTGQPIDVDAVEAAANRLLESGLFKKLSYNFRASKGQATVVFNVEEMSGARAAVVFDNFVWFTDRELNEFVARSIPGFDGTAPETGGAVEKITRALEDLLRARGVSGRVVYTPSADPSGRNPEHVFSVRAPEALRVCSLKFAGTAAVKEESLVQNSAGIFANEYSRQYIRAFAESNLRPLYGERGYLRAAFRPPTAKPFESPDSSCVGVAVTVPVDEGIAYVWGGSEWAGNASLPTEKLEAALGMRPRQVADAKRIEAGVEAVRRAYGRRGYLTARVAAAPAFDDAARVVAYRFRIEEGPQYLMGEVVVNGLSEKDTNNVRTRWRLMPREPFDTEYTKEFVRKALAEFLRDPSTDARAANIPLKVETSETRNDERLTVDVTIDFKKQQQ